MNRMRNLTLMGVLLGVLALSTVDGLAQTKPLWHGQKIKNYRLT